MIGSGIFIAPSIMAGLVGTPGVYLALWLAAGVFTLLGAVSYGELCGMLPRAGGQYVFLREAFGPLVAYLYGWTFFTVIQTGTAAAVAIAFAKFLGGLGLGVGEEQVIFSAGPVTISTAQLAAVGVVLFLTWVNGRGVKQGALVQDSATVLKVGAILALIVLGFWLGKGSSANFVPLVGAQVGSRAGELGFWAAVGLALSKALFAYDAWNTVGFVAEETRDPGRNLPRALVAGTLLVTVVYTAICAVYLYLFPLERMAGLPENRVGAEVGGLLFGPFGIKAVSVAALVSTFGCLNGVLLGGGRVLYAMARDRLFFRGCAEVHPRFHTPVRALWVQGAWTAVLALSGSYSRLLTYVIFASTAFNVATVAAVLVLRRKLPEAERPYRVWGYPLPPLLFVAGGLLFSGYMAVGDPLASLAGVGLVLLGLPAYALFRRRATVA